MNARLVLFSLAGAIAAASASPALADVKAGVDAWSRGDYTTAFAQWQGPAAAGDPDAMFNLAQAYRLGLGVARDADKAESYYAQAAAKGHIQAADIYGLILFQKGQHQAAMPYVQDAARRGDPRSEYILGIAHFNGDIVPKDWVRAYALLTLANGQGLPQAAPAVAEMDKHVSLEQRQMAASLAVELQQQADATRAREMAAADLAISSGRAAVAQAAPITTGSVTGPGTAPLPAASPRIPQPIQSVPLEDPVAEAREAVRQAALATGSESPAEAGADYARPAPAAKPPVREVQVAANAPAAPAPKPAATPAPKPAAAPAPAPKPAAAPAPQPTASSASGPWKVQLGAFGVSGNAEKLWARLSGRPELAGKKRLLVASGGLTKLLAGGFVSQADAAAACSRLKQAGQSCLVTK